MSTTTRFYDRREILAAAAGAAAVAGLPFSSFATPALGAPRFEPLADWSIDDSGASFRAGTRSPVCRKIATTPGSRSRIRSIAVCSPRRPAARRDRDADRT